MILEEEWRVKEKRTRLRGRVKGMRKSEGDEEEGRRG